MNPGYNFTDRTRTVLQLARDEARRLRHEYVGTEHVLLGIIGEGQGVAVAMLATLNVNPADVRAIIEQTVRPGLAAPSAGPELPYTSRSKKVIELAMLEARERGHSYIGTEHLLMGLLREERGMGAQALARAGVTIARVRAEIPAMAIGEPASLNSSLRPVRVWREGPGELTFMIAVVALIIAVVALIRSFR